MPHPVCAGSSPPLPFAATGMPLTAPPRTMLLVEDSRLAAEAVRLLCRRVGIRLRRAETLAAAALHLRVYRPDIALIDLGLPDGSGLDLIAALARGGDQAGRIVAISGDATTEHAALDAGADAFLLKPVTMRRHLQALTGVVPHVDADLSALDRSLGLVATQTRGARASLKRNQGADPLALRDDLRMARNLLLEPAEPAQLDYAGQFLMSVGRALRDETLADGAANAAQRGDRQALVALIDARDGAPPPI